MKISTGDLTLNQIPGSLGAEPMKDSSRSNHTAGKSKGQARSEFDWPTLREAIAFYESQRLCYLPAGWGRKNPSVKWEEYETRLPTMEEKANWFHEGNPTNIGILCGGISGGLVILAFNTQDGASEFFGDELWHRLLASTFVTKSVRGHHVWLRSDSPIKSGFVKKDKEESWLEIRSDGNFTVAPPSLHPSGVLYQAVGVNSIVKPKNLAAFIDERLVQLGLKVRGEEVSSNELGWVPKVLQGVPEGDRDVTCTKLAGYFRNKTPQAVCLAILLPWGDRCIPPFPPGDVRKVVASVYRYKPIPPKSDRRRKPPRPNVFGDKKEVNHAGD